MAQPPQLTPRVVTIISANTEWQVVRAVFPKALPERTPFGEWFTQPIAGEPLVFLFGGWGKVAAAASAQYALDRWQPQLLVNLGTCGGFAGHVERGAILLVARTIIHDINERMGDPDDALAWYSTTLDLSWLPAPLPSPAQRATLVSADADLDPAAVDWLHATHAAIAGDWESGAIAWVAARNHTRCLILRGVTDLVSPDGGEAYDGTLAHFTAATDGVMRELLGVLEGWVGAGLRG